MNARTFNAGETLKNGVPVTVRAIRPTDRTGIIEAFSKLESESIYTRFFQHKPSLSDQDLKEATEVDFESVVGLVVTTESGGRELIIAGGRYFLIDPSSPERGAEIAFMVEEDFHGQGIAGHLLNHLTRIARQKGVSQFEAEVLPRNQAMLAVFSRSGLPMKRSSMDGSIHVTLSLAGL